MTETLVVVSHNRNGYHSESKASYEHARFRSFGSPPCRRGYKDIGLRDIQSTGGILPTPIKIYPTSNTNQPFSPKTPSPSVNGSKNWKNFSKSCSVQIPVKINAEFNEISHSERWSGPAYTNKLAFSPKTPSSSVNEPKKLKKFSNSSSVPIPIKINTEFNELSYSERWAGPAYSNSPPPSSLPIPKFSSRPKRTVSLDLPSSSAPKFNLFSIAKSAPSSPTRDRITPFSGNFRDSDESATKNLRRILNLDSADE